jgi:hypothetical protein
LVTEKTHIKVKSSHPHERQRQFHLKPIDWMYEK